MNTPRSRGFELPRRDQHASGLLKLPAEIRLRVLRLLLKHDGQLLTYRAHTLSGTTEYSAWGKLSSQILGTCQSLYHDAYYVLYCENVVSIRFCGGTIPRRTFDLEVLDASACFFLSVPTCGLHVSFSKEPYTQRRYIDLGPRTLIEVLDTLAHFTRIHITFVQTNDYMIASRCLRRSLFGKRVTVDLGPQMSLFGLTNPRDPYIQRLHPFFSPACFGIWKCESIEFQNGCRQSCCNASFTKLTNLITNSKIQVRDLLPDIWRLDNVLSLLRGLSPGVRASRSLFEFDDNWMKSVHALYNNDIIIFKQARRQLMERVKQVLAEVQRVRKREIEISTELNLAVVDCEFPKEQEHDEDPWRTIWSDLVIGRQEDQIAALEKEISDTWRLMTELLDEDDLLNSAETERTHPQATSNNGDGKFTCSCGLYKIIDSRSA